MAPASAMGPIGASLLRWLNTETTQTNPRYKGDDSGSPVFKKTRRLGQWIVDNLSIDSPRLFVTAYCPFDARRRSSSRRQEDGRASRRRSSHFAPLRFLPIESLPNTAETKPTPPHVRAGVPEIYTPAKQVPRQKFLRRTLCRESSSELQRQTGLPDLPVCETRERFSGLVFQVKWASLQMVPFSTRRR